MDFYEPEEEEIVEYRALSIPALAGWVVGLLSPLALVRPLFFGIPLLAVPLCVWGLINIAHRPAILSGRKLALWGLALSLCFGTAGVINYVSYSAMEERSGRIFAQQWMELMVAGRDKEACQLNLSTYQRVSGRGLEVGFRQNPMLINLYENFQKNYVYQNILTQYRGATVTYIGLEKSEYMKRRVSHIYEFELSTGEGVMRTSRRFLIRVECTQVDSESRYEWLWMYTAFADVKK